MVMHPSINWVWRRVTSLMWPMMPSLYQTTTIQWYGHAGLRINTTTTTILWPFVRDYSDEPVPEGWTILDSTEAEVMGWQRHQLDHMQVICTLLQKDNHASTASLSFFTGWMLFLFPNQQRQSTEGLTKETWKQMGNKFAINNSTKSASWTGCITYYRKATQKDLS